MKPELVEQLTSMQKGRESVERAITIARMVIHTKGSKILSGYLESVDGPQILSETEEVIDLRIKEVQEMQKILPDLEALGLRVENQVGRMNCLAQAQNLGYLTEQEFARAIAYYRGPPPKPRGEAVDMAEVEESAAQSKSRRSLGIRFSFPNLFSQRSPQEKIEPELLPAPDRFEPIPVGVVTAPPLNEPRERESLSETEAPKPQIFTFEETADKLTASLTEPIIITISEAALATEEDTADRLLAVLVEPFTEAPEAADKVSSREELVLARINEIGIMNLAKAPKERQILAMFMQALRDKRKVTREEISKETNMKDDAAQVYISSLRTKALQPVGLNIPNDYRDPNRQPGPVRYWIDFLGAKETGQPERPSRPAVEARGSGRVTPNSAPDLSDEDLQRVLRGWDVFRLQKVPGQVGHGRSPVPETVVPPKIKEIIRFLASWRRDNFLSFDPNTLERLSCDEFTEDIGVVIRYMEAHQELRSLHEVSTKARQEFGGSPMLTTSVEPEAHVEGNGNSLELPSSPPITPITSMSEVIRGLQAFGQVKDDNLEDFVEPTDEELKALEEQSKIP